jgi:hypothetical protein
MTGRNYVKYILLSVNLWRLQRCRGPFTALLTPLSGQDRGRTIVFAERAKPDRRLMVKDHNDIKTDVLAA